MNSLYCHRGGALSCKAPTRYTSLRPRHSALQEVGLRATGEVLLAGELARGVVPAECTWDCAGGVGEVSMELELCGAFAGIWE